MPPCILYSLLFYFSVNEKLQIDDSKFISVIIFITIGFIISAIGTVIARIIDTCQNPKPDWYTPEGEMKHWDKIGLGSDYFQNKLENAWGFYSMNINSSVAIILAITQVFSRETNNCYSVLVLCVLLGVFAYLARLSYRKVFESGKFTPTTKKN